MSTNSNSSFSRLTGARQTMMSWARRVYSFDEVPEIYKNAYEALVGNADSPPYSLVVPSQSKLWTIKPIEKLFCMTGETLYVLEEVGEQVVTAGYPFQDIYSLELGNILLYSWFSINAKTSAGSDAVLRVEFNEANLRHFEPFFDKMRPAPGELNQPEQKVELAKFDYLSNENFKFMNFSRKSLVRGEKVIHSFYQPGKRRSVVSLFGHGIYRSIFVDHITILTDKELILIGDADGIAENKRSRYGGVRNFIPLRSLASLTLEEQPDNLLSLTFQGKAGFHLVRLFDASQRDAVEALKKAVESLAG